MSIKSVRLRDVWLSLAMEMYAVGDLDQGVAALLKDHQISGRGETSAALRWGERKSAPACVTNTVYGLISDVHFGMLQRGTENPDLAAVGELLGLCAYLREHPANVYVFKAFELLKPYFDAYGAEVSSLEDLRVSLEEKGFGAVLSHSWT